MSAPNRQPDASGPASISELEAGARAGALAAALPVQVVAVEKRLTRDNKQFLILTTADATAQIALRVWSDHPQFGEAERLAAGEFLLVTGEFVIHPQFGLDARRWSFRPLEKEEREALLAGPPELRAKQESDFAEIQRLAATISDPRLAAVCQAFLAEHEARFRRSAAARYYHHSRRGGLVEHTAQMMRAAAALSGVYTSLNRDLLLAGALLHDCGKLWETCPPENSFGIPPDPRGELLGHIIIGVEIVNNLWRKLAAASENAGWKSLTPSTEETRLHLLHLIASHHGKHEFGAPVLPKTPEAFALHMIDNLDANLESVARALATGVEIGEGIFDRVRPLPGSIVRPLASASPPPGNSH